MHLSKLQILYCTNDEKHLTSHGPRKPHSNSFFSLVLTCQRWHLSHLHSRTNAYSQVFWLIQWDFQGTPIMGSPSKRYHPFSKLPCCHPRQSYAWQNPLHWVHLSDQRRMGGALKLEIHGFRQRIPSERRRRQRLWCHRSHLCWKRSWRRPGFFQRHVGSGLVGVGPMGGLFLNPTQDLTLGVDDQAYDVAVMFSLFLGMHAILACLFYVYFYDVWCLYMYIYIYILYM